MITALKVIETVKFSQPEQLGFDFSIVFFFCKLKIGFIKHTRKLHDWKATNESS